MRNQFSITNFRKMYRIKWHLLQFKKKKFNFSLYINYFHIHNVFLISLTLLLKVHFTSSSFCSYEVTAPHRCSADFWKFWKLAGKHLQWALRFIKTETLAQVLSFKFLRTPFLQNTSGGCFWIRSTIENSDWADRFQSDGKDNEGVSQPIFMEWVLKVP